MTKFKKGQPAWNKGMNNPWLLGKKRSEETRNKISESNKKIDRSSYKKRKTNPNVTIKCGFCKNNFDVVFSRRNRAKYCSNNCRFKSMNGKAVPWSGVFKSNKYEASHYKVRKLRGAPSNCEICGTSESKRFEWANMTGNYSDINDYKRMCCSCHKKHDKIINNIKKVNL